MATGEVPVGQGLFYTLDKYFHRPLEAALVALNQGLYQRLGGAPLLHREDPSQIPGYDLTLRLRHADQNVVIEVHHAPLLPCSWRPSPLHSRPSSP